MGEIPRPTNGEQSFRGPLKYAVETTSPQLEAGRNTSIYLLITNPYDVPVKIVYAQTKVPVNFKDTSVLRPSFWKIFSDSTLKDQQVVPGVPLSGTGTGDGRTNDIENSFPVVLQPGNTTICEFKLKTKQSTFFTPSVHNLNAQVQYEMDDILNHDTAKYQLNIRAPLKALISGSIPGSIVGTILRFANKDGWQLTEAVSANFFLSIVASMLLAAILVIAFARKKDAQPFITIEDFWGGFFIGFLAGYVGKSLLNPFLLQQGAPPPVIP